MGHGGGAFRPLFHTLQASQVTLVVNNPPANSGDIRDTDLIPGSGGSLGEGNSTPLQNSCLENSMDRGPWLATVHRAAKRQTRLSTHTHTHTLIHWGHQHQLSGLGQVTASQTLLVSVSGDVVPAAGSVPGASPSRLMLLLQPYQVFQAWKSSLWAPLHAKHPRLMSLLKHPAGTDVLAHSLALSCGAQLWVHCRCCPHLPLPAPWRPSSSPSAGSAGPVWLSETLPSPVLIGLRAGDLGQVLECIV